MGLPHMVKDRAEAADDPAIRVGKTRAGQACRMTSRNAAPSTGMIRPDARRIGSRRGRFPVHRAPGRVQGGRTPGKSGQGIGWRHGQLAIEARVIRG